MLTHVLAVVGLSVMCGLWFVIQQWVARHMPDRPSGCGGCGGCHVDTDSAEHASCSSEHNAH